MTRLRLDHIVIGAASLGDGSRWLESKLGVPAAGGGKHAAMGSHNALWRLDGCYLEIIAIDPEAPNPSRPRLFGLDNPVTQAKLRSRPRLLTWVVATNAIKLDVASAPVSPGLILAMRRDQLSWQISVPKDGSLPNDGHFPTLIEWEKNIVLPVQDLPDQGLQLDRLDVGLTGDRARWLTARGIGEPVVFGSGQGLSATVRNTATGSSLKLD